MKNEKYFSIISPYSRSYLRVYSNCCNGKEIDKHRKYLKILNISLFFLGKSTLNGKVSRQESFWNHCETSWWIDINYFVPDEDFYSVNYQTCFFKKIYFMSSERVYLPVDERDKTFNQGEKILFMLTR